MAPWKLFIIFCSSQKVEGRRVLILIFLYLIEGGYGGELEVKDRRCSVGEIIRNYSALPRLYCDTT